jgi:hypothetical protein
MKKPIDFNTVGDDDFDGGSKDGGAGSIEGVNASYEELKLSNIASS